MSFSIITTVLNDEKFILQCLKSVKEQKIKNKYIEHIIIDGGSTDKTISIIKKFKKNTKYIKFFLKKKSSIYQGINYGIKKSKNKIIGILNSDDFFQNEDALIDIKKTFNKNFNLSAVYSNVSIVNRFNETNEIRFFKSRKLKYTDFLKCEHPPHTSLFVKKKIFYKYGFYNENFRIASDFEFMIRIFGLNKVKTHHINRTLIVMRSGGTSNKSLFNIILSNYEVVKSFTVNRIKINWIFIFLKILRKINQLKFIN